MGATRSGRTGAGPAPVGRDRRAWGATIALVAGMLAVPVSFAVILSAGGRTSGSTATATTARALAETDREARVTFRVSRGTLGMRILRDAPGETLRVRGRAVRIVCGSVSGLTVGNARWLRGARTLRVDLPSRGRPEFCALKTGARSVARVVFG